MFAVLLFFVLGSNASDYESLTKVTIDTNFSVLLADVKESYKRNTEFYNNNKICFYNPIDKSVEEYNHSDPLANLFSNMTFYNLVKNRCWEYLTPQQRTVIPKKELSSLCKNILELYGDDGSRVSDDILCRKMPYNLKHLFYAIALSEDPLIYKTAYNSFLQRCDTYVEKYCKAQFSCYKNTIVFGGGVLTLATTVLSIGFGLGMPEHPARWIGPVMSGMSDGIVIFFPLWQYWLTHDRYTKCIDLIQEIKQKRKEQKDDELEKVYTDRTLTLNSIT